MKELDLQERTRRESLYYYMREMIMQALPIEDSDDTSLMLNYRGFYLQISFSKAHPLMVFYFARQFPGPYHNNTYQFINDLNLRLVLGCIALNDAVGCYSYRAAHWLETKLSKERFLEILVRCMEDALRAYEQLSTTVTKDLSAQEI